MNQITTSIFLREFLSFFFATSVLIKLSYIFRVFRCLLRTRIPVTDSVHLSVSLLPEITKRSIYVSLRALQMLVMPLSVILLQLRTKF